MPSDRPARSSRPARPARPSRPARSLARRVVTSAALAIVAGTALAGCVGGSTPSTSPTPSASASQAPDVTSQLLPLYGDSWSADVAKEETARVSAALVSFVDPALVLNDDVHSEVHAATATTGTYYNVIHTLTLDASVDPTALARMMVGDLREAGWIVRDTTNAEGIFLVPMSSDADAAKSWFIVVGADATIAGQPVVSLQIASPDTP